MSLSAYLQSGSLSSRYNGIREAIPAPIKERSSLVEPPSKLRGSLMSKAPVAQESVSSEVLTDNQSVPSENGPPNINSRTRPVNNKHIHALIASSEGHTKRPMNLQTLKTPQPAANPVNRLTLVHSINDTIDVAPMSTAGAAATVAMPSIVMASPVETVMLLKSDEDIQREKYLILKEQFLKRKRCADT
jgi:hypothetical protein